MKQWIMVFVLFVFLVIGLAFGLAACNKSSSGQKELFMQKLQSETNEKIISLLYDDYDGDGKYEAFALTGKESAEGGEPWFVSESVLVKLDDTDWCAPPEVVLIGGKKFIKYEKIYATGRPLFLLCVENSKPQSVLSGGAQDLQQIGDGTFTVQQNTLDAGADGTGRTLKQYWLYYDNGFHEYGGIEITESELLEFNGAESVLKEIQAGGGVLKNILYRANHIINVNYQTPQGMNRYINLQYDDTSVSVLPTDHNGGVYLAALLPEIATYPAAFHHPRV
ncbi:MAG TPA: hypothetical protein DCZ10_12820 [Pelotomaculum sp.]|nr:hypothetical protein [Pelotomaculum sp.]